mmetsp:Transcript_9029/g.17668  ORF Transcript_9029/g.17668 Transcript_9029/m.17668 type:complete len:494 (-) Transcript_9029:421-1902(-)
MLLNTLLPLLEAFLQAQQVAIAADLELPSISLLEGGPEGIASEVKTKDKKNKDEQEKPFKLSRQRLQQSPPFRYLQAFCERHRRALNALIKQQPQLLTGGLATLIRLCPSAVDFDNKRAFFRQRLRALRGDWRAASVNLHVRRQFVFDDSFHQLQGRSGDEMKGKLHVTFQGEEGIDQGGLTREWFGILAREMFNPNYALFQQCGTKAEFNYPNPVSHFNPDHLHYFKFIGRVIGKALLESISLEAYFARSFYKHLLGRKTTPSDAEALDPEFYKNLNMISEHSLEDLGIELTFSVDEDEFGKKKVVELKPGGKDEAVTEENKQEYIELICEHKMTEAIRPQLEAILSGFHELIPPNLVGIFDDKELELLMSGLPEVDLSDLKKHTMYAGYTEQSEQVQWFWRTLESFDQSQLANFLQFVTGTSKVPLEGFRALQGMRGAQKFSIHRAFGDERLPSAHTCFNQLDLPAYRSEESLKTKLLQAISMAREGFGFC